MANPSMEYYLRSSHNNQISEWEEVGSPYSDWIQAYFQQPIRDQMVDIVVEDDDGDDITLQCMADSNNKITGILNGQRIEIVQCHSDKVQQTLVRYP